MHPTTRFSRFHQTGFSLIELMVGLTIGMLSAIVIMQVMTVFEAQRRTTSGSADAQTNGGIALYSIAREMQMAGYPLLPVTDSALECTTLTDGGVGAPTNTPINRLSPVTIVDGGVGSDTITVRYGTTLMGGALTQITASPIGSEVPVLSSLGCQPNDVTLVSAGNTCAMSTVALLTTVAGTPPIYKIKLANTAGATAGANLGCMGSWNEITYSVSSGNLDRSGIPNVAGVVNLQAQYGISATTNSNTITSWVDATGIWAPATITVLNRNRIKTIRIAVVARNAKKEPDNVSTGLSWAGGAIDLTADPDWARYRYRVFETIIPLRNVIWSKDTL